MPKTTYACDNVINVLLRNTPFTPPVQVHCGLFLVAPTDPDDGGTEVSGNGYARQVVSFGVPASGSSSNLADVVFPVNIVADWGTVVAFGIFDASSGGNLLYYANLSSSRDVVVNDQMRFPTGQLVAEET